MEVELVLTLKDLFAFLVWAFELGLFFDLNKTFMSFFGSFRQTHLITLLTMVFTVLISIMVTQALDGRYIDH